MVTVDALSRKRWCVVRSPSRLVLTGSVLGALVASGGTAFTMENNVADAAVEIPGFTTADEQATAPSETSLTLGPPVSGAQIAAIALAPARDRAATLAAERAKADAEAAARALDEADEDDDDEDSDGREGLRELQKRFKNACEQGIIEGAVCRGT